MKVLALFLGLVLCFTVSARDGFTLMAPEDLPNLEDVMTIGTRSALMQALKENKINPAVYHIERLYALGRQELADVTNYEVVVVVHDKAQSNKVKATVETILQEDNATGEYTVTGQWVTMGVPQDYDD